MGYELDRRLVVGVASSALFSLGEANEVFETQGEEEYRRYQEERLHDPLEPGMAFPFVERLLSLNDLADSPEDSLVEVIVLSHNDPDTGLRVMKSTAHHGLGITRAAFTQGQAPFAYIPAFNISLFLSGNGEDVRRAIEAGHPAGQVLDSQLVDVDGGYVSNEFPTFTPKESAYDDSVLLAYLVHVLNSPASLAEIDAESQGSTKTSRNRLGQAALLKMQVQLPKDPERMARLVKVLNTADALRDELKRVGDSAQSLRDAFGGLMVPVEE